MNISLKHRLSCNIKNSLGWTSSRKIVVFSVDDYGNVRIASRKARERLKKVGLNLDKNRFDQYDTLETAEDLELLFDVLQSVKDKHQHPAIFTPYTLPANIDFEAMMDSNGETYHYQLLTETFKSIPGHENSWSLWQQGMNNKIFLPQFHGREHVNIKLLKTWLRENNPLVRACLEERSWAGLDFTRLAYISYVESFSFDTMDEQKELINIAQDGANVFEKVFGYRASAFTAPGAPAHRYLEENLLNYGIKYIDTPLLKNEHQGHGIYKKRINILGSSTSAGQFFLQRNAVFEPLLDKRIDWVDRCMAEIEIAFKWNKPANISSHRVNFCGKIDSKVRSTGLKELKRLLQSIVKQWPEVEFMATNELGNLIAKTTKL